MIKLLMAILVTLALSMGCGGESDDGVGIQESQQGFECGGGNCPLKKCQAGLEACEARSWEWEQANQMCQDRLATTAMELSEVYEACGRSAVEACEARSYALEQRVNVLQAGLGSCQTRVSDLEAEIQEMNECIKCLVEGGVFPRCPQCR